MSSKIAPIPEPVPRRAVHSRDIQCQGYIRKDGLWDIEGLLRDVKSYSFLNEDRGQIPIGEPLHEMLIRLTMNDQLEIVDAIAHTSYAPFRICPAITDAYQGLIGVKIAPGFSRVVKKKFSGLQGCTHLNEIIRILATVAIQTIRPTNKEFLLRHKGEVAPKNDTPSVQNLINSCHAFSESNPKIRQFIPLPNDKEKTKN